MTATLWLWAACLAAAAVLAVVAWSLATDRGRHVRVRIDGPLLFTAIGTVGIVSLFVSAHLLGVPFGGL